MARGRALVLACLGLAAPAAGVAGNVWVPGIEGVSNVAISSLQERKFSNVVRQQYDFSCGSAALATLLTFHYADPITEQDAFQAMYARGDREKIQKVGFSLLDMKDYLATRGYQADGYQASLDTLAQAGVAAIALINTRGYQHFVVVKGLQDGSVLVGDPALGVRSMSRSSFESIWPSGLLFIIRNRSEVGRQYFNSPEHWRTTARAPLGLAVSNETLDSVLLSLPGLGAGGLGEF